MDASADGSDGVSSVPHKEYQTLFWMPMIFQTANKVEEQLREMLELIADFQEKEAKGSPVVRQSVSSAGGGKECHKRRMQIMGDMVDTEAAATRVEVVLKSEETKYAILTVLKSHFLFRQLHDYELEDVIDSMQCRFAPAGEVIIHEGEHGDVFYVIEEGECVISKEGQVIGTTEDNPYFGDLALMYNCPRAATITASTDCVLWTLDRVFFRQAMVTSSSNQIVQLSQFLSKIPLFESLGIQSLNQLARSLTKQTYDDGNYIIRQGEIGDQFYVIFKGKVRVTSTGDDGVETFLIPLGEGCVFGERAIIKKEPRAANIVADGPVECYYLDSVNFQLMLGEIVDKMNLMNEFRLLRASPVFSSLNDYWLKRTMKSFVKQSLFEGQRLLFESHSIMAVFDGKVESSSGITYGVGGVIGDKEKSAAEIAGAVTVSSFEAIIGVLPQQLLLENIAAQKRGDVETDMDDAITGDGVSGKGVALERLPKGLVGSLDTSTDPAMAIEMDKMSEKRRVTARERRNSTGPLRVNTVEDIEVLEPLGQGSFGTVYLARHNGTRRILALKCLDKEALVRSAQHHYVRREVIALQNFHHPFLSEYYGLILTPRKVLFVLEYISGGELWSYLYSNRDHDKSGPHGGITLQATANYAAIVMLALEHIHGHGYSYRDLKPENLLFTVNGYIKLVDFGFAKPVPFINKSKQIQYRTFTLCGTPEYMAPEVVLTQGHDKSADYWAFGVLVYEMLCRQTPFEGRNQARTFEKIVQSQKFLSFPPGFDPHCKSLIRRLLHPNAALRLGALQNGFDDIRTHACFAMQNVDFDSILAQKVVMDHIPPTRDLNNLVARAHQEFNLREEMEAIVDDDYGRFFNNLKKVDGSVEGLEEAL